MANIADCRSRSAAHFATKLWLLPRRPDLDLSQHLPTAIRAYKEAVGGTKTDISGYHETITQASIRAARAFLRESQNRPLFETCSALMASPLGSSGWPLRHWSHDKL